MSTEPRRTPGSRRAVAGRTGRPRRPRRPGRSGRPGAGAVAGLVLLCLAVAAVALTGSPAPVDRTATAGRTLVDSTLLSCPSTADLQPQARLRTALTAGLADVATEEPLPTESRLVAGPPGEAGSPLQLARGEVSPLAADPAPRLEASGAAAVGLFADRVDRASGAGAVTACAAPRGSWWFTGAGATLDHTSTLLLTNVDPGPAVVTVRVYGPDGPVDTVGTRGIPLGPGEQLTLPLADVAPQSEELAVQVAAERGRVTAALLDRFAPRPGAAAGLEWLPGSERAARVLRLAGVPATAGDRTLLLGNPSDLEALVQVEVAGANGTFAPTGLDAVSVAPGTVTSVGLDDVLPADEPVALRIRSRVPVVGAVRSTGRTDSSYAGPVDVLVDPAAVPVPRGADATVQLSAGSVAARASVAAYAADGSRVGNRELALDPGSTRAWDVPARAAYAVVTPLEGAVYGAATYQGTGFTAATPLESLPVRVRTPVVVPGPR